MNTSPIFGGNPYYPTPYPSVMPNTTAYPMTNNLRGVLPGRSVANIDEVAPNELPMDGGVAIFPKNDMSAIYVRSLNGDMSVSERVYIPAPEDFKETPSEEKAPEVSNADILQGIVNMTDQLNDMQNIVKTMQKNSYSKPKNNNRPRNNQNRSDQNEGDDVNA